MHENFSIRYFKEIRILQLIQPLWKWTHEAIKTQFSTAEHKQICESLLKSIKSVFDTCTWNSHFFVVFIAKFQFANICKKNLIKCSTSGDDDDDMISFESLLSCPCASFAIIAQRDSETIFCIKFRYKKWTAYVRTRYFLIVFASKQKHASVSRSFSWSKKIARRFSVSFVAKPIASNTEIKSHLFA